METQVTKSEKTQLAKAEKAQLAKFGDLMDDAEITGSDLIIPKLLLMQQMSTFVVEERARSGEFRSSLGCEKIADKDASVEIIPFKVYKTWITVKKKGNEFVSQVPFLPENAKTPREQILDGEEVINYETLNYYCLLPSEIKEGMFMPYVVSFRSTGYMAGKTLETHRAKLKEFGKPICFKTFILGSEQRENDHGKFYVPTIAVGRNTEDAELNAVKHWYGIVTQGDVKIDESEFSKSEDKADEEMTHEI